MMGMTLVPLVVPVLGGYIAHYISWRAIFVVIALYSLSLFLIGFLYLDNDKRKYDNLSGFFLINFNKYLHVIKNRDFISIVIALVLIYSFQPIYLSTLPFLLKKLSPSEIGKLMAIPVFFELMSMLVVTFLNKILGDKLIIRCGLAAALLGITLLALSYGFNYNGAMYITFFMALTIFGGGLIFPNLLSKALKIHPESLSYASATLGILQQFGGAAILTMIGLLQIQSQIGLAFVLFLCLAAAGFFILKSRRTGNDKEFA
jgi:DHA1 family bicyclomycin/chloramphenicol resistance-like MFS transporter